MAHKTGKIAEQIIALQNNDGTWGNEFHSLSVPNNKKPLTTEQALRRLKLLGFTINDEPIRKSVDCHCVHECLSPVPGKVLAAFDNGVVHCLVDAELE